MDSVFSSVKQHQHHRPSPPLPPPSSDSDDHFVEVTPPPPPRHPLRRGRTDTDAASPTRPCPPPPLPAREPLGRPRHATDTARQPTATALDSVVPLSRWPLRYCGRPPGVEVPPSTHVSLDDCGRRGPSSTLPVNVMVVSPTPSVGHAPPPAVAPPKTCPNGRGNVYVDSPTVNRSAAVVGGGGLTQQPATATGRPAHTECRVGPHQPPSNPPATSPTVKFNPVVQTNGGSTGLAGSEKATGVVAGQPRSTEPGVCRGGVMCQRCGRCRCANCTAPRELPRRWIGDCECSVQRCVSVTSCLCCVEALFYHCLDGADADDGGACGSADDPCACCERPRCCLRWTLMAGLAATVLPCLCCYCPLQCSADALTACYNTCATPRGCRCRGATHEASSGSSTRGLLAESESSST